MKDKYYSPELDGKKVIFIGNSMIYYGQCVEDKSRILEQQPRENDRGYFYQICASHGVDVSVTNWTFGGHQLADIFSDRCPYCIKKDRGIYHHMSFLRERYYDYVIVSEGSRGYNDFVERIDEIIDTFRAVNPNVKFVYLCHLRQHMLNQTDVLHNLEAISQKGVIIADWGKVLFDILNDKKVPGGSEEYYQNSFIISQSEKDGHHQNLLAGYITALTAYCVITGKEAAGQSYDFYNDTEKNPAFDIDAYKAKYYCYGDTQTNFDKIFANSDEMLALQKAVDETIRAEHWHNYGKVE